MHGRVAFKLAFRLMDCWVVDEREAASVFLRGVITGKLLMTDVPSASGDLPEGPSGLVVQ